MSAKVTVTLELWNGRIHEQKIVGDKTGISLAKIWRDKYKNTVKWLCVFDDEQIYYEYIDSYYLELLETLYYRNPNKKGDEQYYKNLLTDLNKKNPALFDKYLEYFAEIN